MGGGGVKYDLDRSTVHPKVDPARVVHFMSLRCLF